MSYDFQKQVYSDLRRALKLPDGQGDILFEFTQVYSTISSPSAPDLYLAVDQNNTGFISTRELYTQKNRWNFLYPRPEFYKGAIVSNDTETYWHYDETAKAITLELMSNNPHFARDPSNIFKIVNLFGESHFFVNPISNEKGYIVSKPLESEKPSELPVTCEPNRDGYTRITFTNYPGLLKKESNN